MKNNVLILFILFFYLFFFNSLFSNRIKGSGIQDIQADYIIIYPEKFYDELVPLINYRQNQNLVVYLKSLEEIYIEYADTLSMEIKIQYFVSNALEFWQDPKPKYLLLVGDTEILPSFKIASSFNGTLGELFISLDEKFAINIYEEDINPDIAVGRLPVIDSEELSDLINKIIYFESELTRQNYTKDFLFLSDTTYYFQQFTLDFTDTIMPANYTYDWIDLNQDTVYSIANEKFITALNQSPLFLNYYGHGNIDIWADSTVFMNSHIDQLSPAMNPLILTSIACKQRFDSIGYRGIGEKMLLRPSGGAVAVIGSAGLAYPSESILFLHTFYNKLFSQNRNIGDLILEAKRETNHSNRIDNTIARYTLLGDPALKIPHYLLSDIRQTKNAIPINYIICKNYPNPFNIVTTIAYQLPESGFIKLSIYDVTGRLVDILFEGTKMAGTHSIRWRADHISSGIYYYRIETEGYSIVKKMAVIK